MAEVDFDYVYALRDEYLNVFLDSQMLISDRMKYAGEVPKLLGNFERLHKAIQEIYVELELALEDGCMVACCAPGGQRSCHLVAVLDKLEELEVKQ